MMDWVRLLKEYGLPTLIAVGLAYLLKQNMADAREERASHTVILIDQISDLREKTHALESVCRKAP